MYYDIENKIFLEDALTGLKKIPDASIDCCISSPPYFGLRDYNHEKQLGREDNFLDFINNLIEIYNEVFRVLKLSGTCFVNLGDSYNTISGGMIEKSKGKKIKDCIYSGLKTREIGGMIKQVKNHQRKSLLMIPERFAIDMINNNWILRNQIIWHKPNKMPESIKDRFTVDFEKIFFFTKISKNYYFEQQFEPIKEVSLKRAQYGWKGKLIKNNEAAGGLKHIDKMGERFANPKGRNKRTVWSINTKGYSEAHFATYPEKLIEPMIKSGCPENGLILDPFMGAGTTALVAKKLNRKYLGFEINPEYKQITETRLYNEFGLF